MLLLCLLLLSSSSSSLHPYACLFTFVACLTSIDIYLFSSCLLSPVTHLRQQSQSGSGGEALQAFWGLSFLKHFSPSHLTPVLTFWRTLFSFETDSWLQACVVLLAACLLPAGCVEPCLKHELAFI